MMPGEDSALLRETEGIQEIILKEFTGIRGL